MERIFKLRTTKVMYKPLPGTNIEDEKYQSKKIKSSFVCDLDDIKFVDYAVKNNGELYKTKCLITHSIKGDIMVNHTFDEVHKIVNDKYKTNYITIKGFKK